MSERRRWKRLLLRIKGRPSYHCVVDVSDSERLNCTLMDISCGGMRLRLDETGQLPHLMDGQGVVFVSFDAPRFNFLIGVRGLITWYRPTEHEFGISFQNILRKSQVEDLLDG